MLYGCSTVEHIANYKNNNNITNNNLDTLNILDDVELIETISSNSVEVYNVYSYYNYSLEKFEPESTIYSGIHLEQDTGNFIKNFEDDNNIYHNLYLNEASLDESFLLSWVLSCYANSKVPFITISPPENQEDLYSKALLLERVKEFGALNIPIFVNFYPLTLSTKDLADSTSVQDYISFIQVSSRYFNVYAPNVCFVWSVDYNLAYQSKDYYAGESYIDWVGLDIYENLNADNQLERMFNELDYFYNIYSSRSPIFINLKISHFGDGSYTYNITDKISELNRFYNDFIQKYPRLKMINYINQDLFKANSISSSSSSNDAITPDVSSSSPQNYLVTDNQEILNVYKNNLAQNKFSKEFININYNTSYPISSLKKEEVVAYKFGQDFFKDSSLSSEYKPDDIIINNLQKYIIIK